MSVELDGKERLSKEIEAPPSVVWHEECWLAVVTMRPFETEENTVTKPCPDYGG
jgi:hypothetical protein